MKLALLLAALVPATAAAQPVAEPYVAAELMSDDRRRGLSMSDGRPTIAVSADVPLAGGLSVAAEGTALRDSARHNGADLGLDLAARYRHEGGGWWLSGGVVGHLFAGGSGDLDYVELESRGGYRLGPAGLALGASYAPSQRAIGGDNLYLSADLDVGLIGTPFTLSGGIGRSSGDVDNAARAARLRPGGQYWDYRLGAEYVRGPIAAGARYTSTSIDAGDRIASPFSDQHVGGRVTIYLRVES
ncbi:hypothetical protein ACFB49_01160 [Sphingomonas sp. DBB INV C78]|uniref:TorF family putative porin n=1 Tax=Sphingomonas sp. DBB INV C78 TaxID=3349434 RepID=UPI0036D3A1FA